MYVYPLFLPAIVLYIFYAKVKGGETVCLFCLQSLQCDFKQELSNICCASFKENNCQFSWNLCLHVTDHKMNAEIKRISSPHGK